MGQGPAVLPPEAASGALAGRQLEELCDVEAGRRPLGQGAFGTVWRARLKRGGAPVAVKALEKRRMSEMRVPRSMVESEVALMRECKGKEWFVQLVDFIETRSTYFIVLELCDGGNLEDAAKQCEGKLGERRVVHLMWQMLQGIQYLQSKRICHRDIKPQNAMLAGSACNQDAKVKLADFGIATRLKPGQLLTEKVGTPAFMAPEMHLLPGRSTGYDHKVDVWAVGVVMVFLLAYEYPFVDGAGRLLQNQLLHGDLPLWDTDVFSGLFQRVQEVAGIRRKRPSKTARDLVRLLLTPKRQNRPSAHCSLQHPWFEPGTDYSDRGDDAPLLEWHDFAEGLGSIERELQRVAVGVADAAAGVAHAVGGVQVAISGCEPPPVLDPSDDRLQSCVVCYQSSGSLGYLCPQCHHTVCLACLQKLPKAECPYCRHEASDVALTQKVAHFARSVTAEARQASGAALEAALAVGASERLGKAAASVAVDVDVRSMRPRTEEEQQRRAVCHFCQAPSSATSHVCPLCSASICFACAQRELADKPRCPNCGDVERNATELGVLLAAGEAWSSVAAVSGTLGAHASLMMGALAARASEVAGVTLPALASNPDALNGAIDAADARDAPHSSTTAVKRQLTGKAQLQVSHTCHFCGCTSSSLDLACPVCNASVCMSCARAHLTEDPRCPNCQDAEFCSAHSLRLMQSVVQVRDSAHSLWQGLVGVGQELLVSRPGSGGPSLSVGECRPVQKAPAKELPALIQTGPATDIGRTPLQELSVDPQAKSPAGAGAMLARKPLAAPQAETLGNGGVLSV